MTEAVASLPMYDIPELAEANDAWWSGLARHFAEAGVPHPPAALTRPGEGAEFWLRRDLLFSQTCGFPLVTALAGKVSLLATPCYDAPGCDGPDYSSLVIVAEDRLWRSLHELRGWLFAVNSPHSWSGHHAFRLLLAMHTRMGGKFCDTILTGSHIASVAAVAEGRADFAAIDCVVHANLVRYRPQALAGTRILCSTPGMPGLPLIAGRAVSSGHLRAMKEGLANAAADSGLAEVRRALGIRGVSFTTPADYGRMQLALRKADNAGVEPLA